MSGPEPADIWREVLAWLRVAGSDQHVAQVCMTIDPPAHDAAAFHCQQAAEKLLKGFLVGPNLDFGKTHDLGRLARAVASRFPSVAPLLSTIDDWTAWNIAARYPDLAEPQPEPTVEELSRALDVIGQCLSLKPAPARTPARPPNDSILAWVAGRGCGPVPVSN